MSINLSGTYCIFSAKENEYDCNIVIRSNSFVVDVSYVFTKSWIKEKEICYSICYSLLPRNIKLKCASKCKKKKKNWINRSTVKEMWGNVFKRLYLRESKHWKNYPRNWPCYELDSVNKLWRFIPKFFWFKN